MAFGAPRATKTVKLSGVIVFNTKQVQMATGGMCNYSTMGGGGPSNTSCRLAVGVMLQSAATNGLSLLKLGTLSRV